MSKYSYERMVNMENQIETCEYIHVHQDIVDMVKHTIPTEDKLYNVSDLFKLFGDKTRMKILYVLSVSEMCVCDVATLVDMTQSAISHQLKKLKQGKLVKFRKVGKSVFYSLADEHVKTIIEQGIEHIKE